MDILQTIAYLPQNSSHCTKHTLTTNGGRCLSHTVRTRVLPASLLPQILLDTRLTLFPNNSLGPSAPPNPSAEEQIAIREQAAHAVLSLIPPVVARTFFASSDEKSWVQQVEEMLDVFGDARFNIYWIYAILELVLVRLMPELAEKGWSELLVERGVTLGVDDQVTESIDRQAEEDHQEKSSAVTQAKTKQQRKRGVPAPAPARQKLAGQDGVRQGRKLVLTGK